MSEVWGVHCNIWTSREHWFLSKHDFTFLAVWLATLITLPGNRSYRIAWRISICRYFLGSMVPSIFAKSSTPLAVKQPQALIENHLCLIVGFKQISIALLRPIVLHTTFTLKQISYFAYLFQTTFSNRFVVQSLCFLTNNSCFFSLFSFLK